MDEEIKVPENMMGTLSENKLLLKIALPLIFSMLVQAFYNVVDSYFVAKIGENALSAVSLAFPVQNLMIGFGIGTGIGMNALLSRRLGQKNQKEVNSAAMNGVFLAVINTVVFMIFGFFFARTYFASQTDVAEIIDEGTKYLSICTLVSFGIFLDCTFSRLLQSTGRTKYSMIGQVSGAVTNIVLNPILVLGWFGFPRLGVAGSAYATVIGQILAMIIDLTFNLTKNKEIEFQFRGFRPSIKVIGQIYSVGIPAILTSTLFSVFAYGMNRILLGFSTAATAVLGVYIKLQSFIFMPVFGLTSGMIPIVAYNYGAKNPDRIRKTTRLALMYATGIMACGILLFQFAPRMVLSLFIENPVTMEMGVAALKIISLGYIFASVMFVIGAVFQALGHGVHTLLLQSVRQLVGALPLAYLFSLTGNVDMVWWSLPCAELLAAIASFALYIRVRKRELYVI